MVEAQVPNELMADAMRSELDDLKAALERHDLELSDMTFGEATQHDAEHEGGERAANDDPSHAANDAGDGVSQHAPNGGVRIVA